MQHENKENGGQLRKHLGSIYLCIYCMQLKEGGNKGGEEKEREKREKKKEEQEERRRLVTLAHKPCTSLLGLLA